MTVVSIRSPPHKHVGVKVSRGFGLGWGVRGLFDGEFGPQTPWEFPTPRKSGERALTGRPHPTRLGCRRHGPGAAGLGQ